MTDFIAELSVMAPPAGGGAYAFVAEDGGCNGWVQFIIRSDSQIDIHRIWTLRPGKGNGSMMLRTVCALADKHGIEMRLKPLPFGRKPFRMSRHELAAWYQRHGFAGAGRKMIRKPQFLPANDRATARGRD